MAGIQRASTPRLDHFAVASLAIAVVSAGLAWFSWSSTSSQGISEVAFWAYVPLAVVTIGLSVAGEHRSRIRGNRKGRVVAMAAFVIGVFLAVPPLLFIALGMIFPGLSAD